MGIVGSTTAAFGGGLASALVPLVNAEALVALASTSSSTKLQVLLVVAVAAGQTVGKLVFFESARRGSQRLRTRHVRSARTQRWAGRVDRWLASPWSGSVTVLLSAALGVPPLAMVALAAGAAGQRRTLFALLCLIGWLGSRS